MVVHRCAAVLERQAAPARVSDAGPSGRGIAGPGRNLGREAEPVCRRRARGRKPVPSLRRERLGYIGGSGTGRTELVMLARIVIKTPDVAGVREEIGRAHV